MNHSRNWFATSRQSHNSGEVSSTLNTYPTIFYASLYVLDSYACINILRFPMPAYMHILRFPMPAILDF
jgi:hypothetical protein